MQTLNVHKHVSDIKNAAHTDTPLAGIDLETFVVESWRRCLSDYSIDNGGIIFANPNAPTGIAVNSPIT